MPYIINNECTNCGTCEPECPLEAISEKGDKRVVNLSVCADCGVCADVCPEECIAEA
ncbi:MAG: 4Fe-4S binding protein [Desulfobacula sp.]|nr:4Fe-4S binding protein [Desulfobacula sp.]